MCKPGSSTTRVPLTCTMLVWWDWPYLSKHFFVMSITHLYWTNLTNSAHLSVQAGGTLPVSEQLYLSVRVPDILSIPSPAADHRQPAAGVGRSQEAGTDVSQSGHARAGQQQPEVRGRRSGITTVPLSQPAQHQPPQLRSDGNHDTWCAHVRLTVQIMVQTVFSTIWAPDLLKNEWSDAHSQLTDLLWKLGYWWYNKKWSHHDAVLVCSAVQHLKTDVIITKSVICQPEVFIFPIHGTICQLWALKEEIHHQSFIKRQIILWLCFPSSTNLSCSRQFITQSHVRLLH